MNEPLFLDPEGRQWLVAASSDGAKIRLIGAPGQIGGRVWAETDSLTVDVHQESSIALPVQISFGTDLGTETPAMRAAMGVLPGVTTRLVFPLSALNAETVFLPRTPGRLKATVQGVPTRVEEVCWVEIGVGKVDAEVSVTLSNWQIVSDPLPLVPTGPVLVDELGQWTARDWPGKIPDAETLVARLRSDAEEPLSDLPADLTAYGGSATIRFEATGWFRTQHDGNRWWLVDPNGGAFWSTGADCVGPGESAIVTGNEALCAWLPEPRQSPEQFSWAIANLVRAFGGNWKDGWVNLTRRSLRSLGFNTIGNWSDGSFARDSGLPYVWPLADFPTTAVTVFRDFPDVFAPEYRQNAEAFARQLIPLCEDRNLVGYFLRNEPLWAFGAFRLAEEMLKQPPERAPYCRRALVAHLRTYDSSSQTLQADWNNAIERLDDLESVVLTDNTLPMDTVREYLAEFSRKMIDAYVRIPSDACKAVDPHHLNLGMRWAWIATDDLLSGSDACDVFSMNTYSFHVDADTVRKAAQASGRPVLIGEFHFGATDRGLPSGGLKGVRTQAERGQAYRYFVEGAAALPEVIGTHYFQWNDQPLLGRFDGENWQIGLVDVCHQVYPEVAAAAWETHQRLYDVASGAAPPFALCPEEAGRLGY